MQTISGDGAERSSTLGGDGAERSSTLGGDGAERGSAGSGSIVVTGVAGQLGTQLRVRGGSRVRGLTSAQLDITDPVSVYEALGKLGPGDVVINCAAYTAVDNAESDRSTAAAVNAEGPGYLAEHTARTGASLIHISTDYVFPGSSSRPLEPGDPTGPDSVYGATKLAGEQAVRAGDPSATIVRTAWVYTGAANSADFVGTMRRLERERDTVSVVTDQVGSPTYSGDLADGLLELAGQVSGPDSVAAGQILHATNAGSCSWFDLAQAVFVEVGADPSRVLPTTSAEFPRPAPRPAYSVLSGRAWQVAELTPLRDWRAALTAAVHHGE
ncbi:dTDP-4-dehydrorhamnose reductase [Gordonia rubripertincta]|uniref:dTDP-4-dehydrorhamnose reductase n=1 Tax=Gordonia rubripertincta TaxID=36822 RepID=A0ABT4N0Y6_GORRU|nr:dTDP-4-dehydrorhamnose reductase [Gordonia rubripertincta]MCZ4552902.1 dTDP-4-dehydrorhamnose reductase [Gordonia rubripertincta]